MKRIILLRSLIPVIIVSMIISLSLIGCKTTTSAVTTAAETTSATATAAETTSTAAETTSGEVVEIEFWDHFWGGADYETQSRALIDQFNSTHPNIHVNITFVPWDNYFQIWLTAVTGGNAPDCGTGPFQQSIQYAQMDEVLYLDDIIEQWKTEGRLADFIPGSIELHQWQGKQAGIPWIVDPRYFLYRQDVFTAAGIIKEPETWQEFIDACIAIKEKTDYIPFAFPTLRAQVVETMMFSNGVGAVDKDGNLAFNDPRVVEVFENFFGALNDAGAFPEGMASYKDEDVERLYMSNELAIKRASGGSNEQTDPAIMDNTKVMGPLIGLSNTSQEKHALGWINPFVAYKQTKHPEETKIFAKWWLENNISLWKDGGAVGFPAQLTMANDPYWQDNWKLKYVVEKILPYLVTPCFPSTSLYPQFSDIDGQGFYDQMLQEILTGNKDYKGLVEKYTAKMQPFFAK